MKKNLLFILWVVLYVLCASLSIVVAQPTGFTMVLAVFFFVPGGILLYQARTENDRKPLRLVRWLSLGSLALTLIILVVTIILSPLVSEGTGYFLHVLLALVSAPMLISGSWVLSLFLWACLLMGSFRKKK